MNVDVAIIGAGTSGLNARREVEKRGKSWVLIDPGPLGTTCARVGCMPSKLLIAAAETVHAAEHAGTFGVRIPDVAVDGRAVMERVRGMRDGFVGGVLRSTERLDPERLRHARATFTGPTSLALDDGTSVEARAVVIATGSKSFVPPDLDPVRDRVLLNDDLFELEDLPESVAVVGSGVIALELGQALGRLGVRVSFFNPFDELGPTTDPAVSASVRAVLGSELDLHVGVSGLGYERAEDGVRVRWSEGGQVQEAQFEYVLAAAGRRPNIEGLGLEATGATLERGVPVHDRQTMQVGDLPIFIAGDVTGERPLLHEASDEGRIAGRNAGAWPEDILAHVRRVPLAIAFTDPNIAVVGKRWADLEPGTFATGSVDYGGQGRSKVMAVNRGWVNIYAERGTGLLLGAEMFGPRVEHTAHLLAWAISERMTVQRALQMPYYHPVVEEGIRTALRGAAVELKLASHPCIDGLDCSPGS